MNKVQELMERYEKIDSKVERLREEVQQDKVRLEYEKEELKSKMMKLQEKGIDASSISRLEEELALNVKELTSILDSTERKLDEINSK